MRSKELINAYDANTKQIKRLIDTLTHSESLLIPPFPTNCVNWLLGHILVSRHHSLTLSGGSDFWPENLIQRYDTGSSPIDVEDHRFCYFEDLVKDLEKSQIMLTENLSHCPDDFLKGDFEDKHGKRARWLCIRSLHWHETYHIG